MADYSSLGVFGGYYGQQQAATETAMLKELAPIQVEQAKTNLQSTKLDMQIKNFDLVKAETLFTRQEAMLRQMQAQQNTGASGGPAGQANSEAENSANWLFQQSRAEHDNGLWKEASEDALKASQILENNSKIQTRAANETTAKLKEYQNLLQNVHDEASWDELRATFSHLHPDAARNPDVQKILQMKYPGQASVKRMQDTLKMQEEQARTAAALAEAKARTAEAARADAYREQVIPAIAKLDSTRAAAVKKAGGGGASNADVTAMQKIIQGKFGDEVDKDSAYVLARHLAEDVQKLVKQGMSKADAQDFAMENADKSQYFAGIRRPRSMPGATPSKPLSLPEDGDPAKMKDGMYYMTPKKGLMVWDARAGGLRAPDPDAIKAQDQDLPEEPSQDEPADE